MTDTLSKVSLISGKTRQDINAMMLGIENIIVDEVCKARRTGEDLVTLELSVGILYIKVLEDYVEYRFVPSARLTNKLKKAVKLNDSPLVTNLEETLLKNFSRVAEEANNGF